VDSAGLPWPAAFPTLLVWVAKQADGAMSYRTRKGWIPRSDGREPSERLPATFSVAQSCHG
jgi:hypothetical protein